MTANDRNISVAIIGLGAVMPDAKDIQTFWQNIRTGKDSVREVPPERWRVDDHYDPDPKTPDRTYSKIGAFVRDFLFDSLAYRIPPRVANAMDNVQKWAVVASQQALADSGYDKKDFDRNRTAVVIGNSLAGELQYITNLRVYLPRYVRALRSTETFQSLPENIANLLVAQFQNTVNQDLPPITEDSMPGELSNIIAGRVANVFGLRGPNFTADAACASSLAALESAVDGLVDGRYDMVLTGGADSSMSPHSFVKFSKIGALSPDLSCPFDKRANGFVMGEGCGILLLKRLADAERDGDKIYAVLRGMGSSSDGRGKGITAPNPVGPKLALERAYANSGVNPADVSFLEAHGTSTAAGDMVEGNVVCEFFNQAGATAGSIAMGSIKSQIGHLKSAAGAASLIKTTLAIYEGLIPASLHFDYPNPRIPFPGSPVFVPTQAQPWEVKGEKLRIAGVSSFGFGGTNFHAILSEYRSGDGRPKTFFIPSGGNGKGKAPPSEQKRHDRRMLAVGAENPTALLRFSQERLSRPREEDPHYPPSEVLSAPERLVIDYGNQEERSSRGKRALAALASDDPKAWRALAGQGIFRGRGGRSKVAFLFPGQGSQYINMLQELRAQEPVVAEVFAEADKIMEPILGKPLTAFIYTEDSKEAQDALRDTNVCQPAMLATDVALSLLLEQYGIRPDVVAGHSLGEYAALVVSGMLSFQEAMHAVSARAREMSSVKVEDKGKMVAVLAPSEKIQEILEGIDGVSPANFNSRNQTVIAGGTAPVEEAMRRFKLAGIRAMELQVSHAFHSHIVAPATEPLRKMLAKFSFQPPRVPLVANFDARPYDPDPNAIESNLDRLAKQIASPVRFVESIETMYCMGVRLFVEVGAKRVLANFVLDVLEDLQVLTVATNHPKLGDWPSFTNALAACAAAGITQSTEQKIEEEAMRVETRPTRDVQPVPRTQPEIVISGVSLGLPGIDHPVFDPANTERILEGKPGIDEIPLEDRRRLAAQRIVRLVKESPGGPVFEVIENPDQVARLSGRKGTFDLAKEFGLDPERVNSYDTTTQLAVAAGLLALKDAGIPLVMHHRNTRNGRKLPIGFRLPEQLADETGIIFASAFPGYDRLVEEINRRHRDEVYDARLEELKKIAETVGPLHAVRERMEALEQERGERYSMDRKFIFRALNMGHAQLAELIGARGPNAGVNAACASTTQALVIASDWIRNGRCRRVLVVGADDITNSNLAPWLVGGLFATGAVTDELELEKAALPFDRRRNGMIAGMGAVGLVVEDAKETEKRGMAALVRILGSVLANSAYHGTRLNLDHIAQSMDRLVSQAEREYGLDRHQMAPQTVFVSHETYTPARGGSASAEVHALRKTFGNNANRIVIANTKGFTGHPMGVGIEDGVAVRILEHQQVPPIPNHREEDPDLGQLNLSKGGHFNGRYALRLAAGFGSQIALTLTERIKNHSGQNRDRVVDRFSHQAWLNRVSEISNATLEVVNNTLRVKDVEAYLAAAGPQLPQPVPSTQIPTVELPPVEEIPSSTKSDSQPTLSVEAPIPASSQAEPARPVEDQTPQPPLGPEPVATVARVLDTTTIQEKILSIVSAKTGYPVEMLDLDLDLEADLGIDTVKQAEMFSEIRAAFGIPKQDDLKLSDYPTLTHIIRFAEEKLGPATRQGAASSQSATEPATAAFQLSEPHSASSQAEPASPAEDQTPQPPLGPEPVATVARVLDTTTIQEKILSIVSAKTGYPVEMLDLDLDLEADLGIDTVKQAEMFSEIRAAFGIPKQDDLKLSDYPTLTHIIRFAEEKFIAASKEEPCSPSDDAVVETFEPEHRPESLTSVSAQSESVRYLAPILVGRPSVEECLTTGVSVACRSFIVGDFNGTAAVLEAALKARGGDPVRIDASGNPDTVAAEFGRLAIETPPRGVWILTALEEPVFPGAQDASSWRRALDQRARLPFRLAKALDAEFAGKPGTFFMCVTRMGGLLGLDPKGSSADPAAGATTGFVKALAREWSETLCKVVDVPVDADAKFIASALIEEAEHDRGVVEVGRNRQGRWGVGLRVSQLLQAQDATCGKGCLLSRDPVVLIAGGAGDIVGQIAADLARHCGGVYYLADLATAPSVGDPDVRALKTDRNELKKSLAERLQGQGERVTPVRVEKALQEVERKAAVLDSLEAIREAGGQAHPVTVDITDVPAVISLVRKILASHGRLDLVLHAAGLEHSQALARKTPESFDRILHVKADGLHALLAATTDVPLSGLMLFGSVAGRFGNAGQTDYSAANDLLAKSALSLRKLRPGLQAVTLAYSGWAGRGMATRGTVPEQMARAGINLIPLEEGATSVRRAFASGFTGELVVARSLGVLAERLRAEGVNLQVIKKRLTDRPDKFPLLGEVLDWTLVDGLRLEVSFDPTRDLYLNDHRIEGTAVFPGVMAVETFAEAATLMHPGLFVVSVEDLAFEAPLKMYRDEPRRATVRLLPTWDERGRVLLATMETTRTLVGPREQTVRHFRARVRMERQTSQARVDTPPGNATGRGINREAIYQAFFHGPSFQVLEKVTSSQDGLLVGWMQPGTETPPLGRQGKLTSAPMFTELAFQAAGIVEARNNQRLGLPAGVRQMKIHQPPENTPGRVTAWVIPRANNGGVEYGVKVVDDRGFVLLELDGYRTSPLPTPLAADVRSGLTMEQVIP